MPRYNKRKRSSRGSLMGAKRRKLVTWRRSLRKKKTSARSKRFSIPRNIAKPPFFKHLAPRVRTTHYNRLNIPITVTQLKFTQGGSVCILPLRLRDPDVFNAQQAPPEDYPIMAGLYKRYRVNAVDVKVMVNGLTNTDDEKFMLCVYSTSTKDKFVDPYNYSEVKNTAQVNSVLQKPNVRWKIIHDSGTTGRPRNCIFNAGRFTIAGCEQMRRMDMDDDEYSGRVKLPQSAAEDPIAQPAIWFRAFSPRSAGFGATRNYQLFVSLKFHVEWFDRRENKADPQPTEDQTDPTFVTNDETGLAPDVFPTP